MNLEQQSQTEESNKALLREIVQLASKVKSRCFFPVEKRNEMYRSNHPEARSVEFKRLRERTYGKALVICAILNGMTGEEIHATLDTVQVAIGIGSDASKVIIPGILEDPT